MATMATPEFPPVRQNTRRPWRSTYMRTCRETLRNAFLSYLSSSSLCAFSHFSP